MTSVSQCVTCSKELPQGALFCAFCGEKQPNPEPPPERLAQASSESFVWDSDLMGRVRELADTSLVSQRSQALDLGNWRDILDASQMMAQSSSPDIAPEPSAPPALLPPRTMLAENYIIEDQIGSGGMAVVYRARDMAMHRHVAIKVLHASLFGKHKIRERFLREAQLMSTLSHPNIVRIHDLLNEEHMLAIVMQYIPGTNLKDFLEQQTRFLSFSSIKSLLSPILKALDEAHQNKVIHRDLKPGNVLLHQDNNAFVPMLTDFGLAKVAEGTNYTMSGVVLGTCHYMSPEQFQSKKDIDQRSDIYALGVMLYQLCTGVCPFQENNLFLLMKAHLSQAPEPPSTLRRETPLALQNLILDALAKNPEERVESCSVFLDRLHHAIP